MPIPMSQFDNHKTKHFLKTTEIDLVYCSNLSIYTDTEVFQTKSKGNTLLLKEKTCVVPHM